MFKLEHIMLWFGLLLFFLFIVEKCDTVRRSDSITTKTDTLYIASKDTTHDVTPAMPPAPTYITNNYTYEAERGPIDTSAVIRDYFNKRGYQDTIRNDSIDIVLHEEVYKNELRRLKVAYKWKAPERIITTTTTVTNQKPAAGFYAGGFLSISRESFGTGPVVNYVYNKNNYGAGFDLVNRSIQLQYSRKLGK